MTLRVVLMGAKHRYPGAVKELIISCDQMECQTAVNDTTIKAGGGLKTMGWQALCLNGAMRHYCPDHNR